MINKEIAEAADCSIEYLYKCQRENPGYPVSGDDEEKIEFLVANKDLNRGRVPNDKKGKTDKKANKTAKKRQEAELAKVVQQLEKNQYKIIATRDEKFLELIRTFTNDLLEDLKEVELSKPQLSFLRERFDAHIQTLDESLIESNKA